MYKNVLQSIDGIAIWPIVSFLIFFVFFIVLLWWALSADKAYITHMKSLPTEDDSNTSTNSEYGKQS